MSYHRPGDAAEAITLHSATEGSAYLAGGQTLLASLNRCERVCTRLIDIRGIAAMRTTSCDVGGLSIGAAVTLSELLRDRNVLAAMPVLADALSHVGNHTVRNCSTPGGHVALADGWSEVNLVLMAGGAIVTTNLRRVPVEEIILGHRSSGLRASELIERVMIGPDALADRYGFHEFTLRAGGGRAIVAAVVRRSAENVISAVLSGVTPSQIILEPDAVKYAPEYLDHALRHAPIDVQPAARWPRDYRRRLGIEALRRASRRAVLQDVE